jgi:hypothetical protein
MTGPAAKPTLRYEKPPTIRLTLDAAPLRHDIYPRNTKKCSLHLTEKHRTSIETQVGQRHEGNGVVRNQLT